MAWHYWSRRSQASCEGSSCVSYQSKWIRLSYLPSVVAFGYLHSWEIQTEQAIHSPMVETICGPCLLTMLFLLVAFHGLFSRCNWEMTCTEACCIMNLVFFSILCCSIRRFSLESCPRGKVFCSTDPQVLVGLLPMWLQKMYITAVFCVLYTELWENCEFICWSQHRMNGRNHRLTSFMFYLLRVHLYLFHRHRKDFAGKGRSNRMPDNFLQHLCLHNCQQVAWRFREAREGKEADTTVYMYICMDVWSW